MAPYWTAWVSEEVWSPGTLVFVLNPGPVNANVTVIFHEYGPAIWEQDDRKVPPQTTSLFVGTPKGAPPEAGEGWVEVTSDWPVVPWGSVPVGPPDGSYHSMVEMRFARVDPFWIKPFSVVANESSQFARSGDG